LHLFYHTEILIHCTYLGIFGYEYGSEDHDGISPTEREYNHATKHSKTRLVYVWGSDEKKRHPKIKQLIRKSSSELIRRRIEDFNALTSEVYASLVDYLDCIGALRVLPFNTSVSDDAALKHLSRKRIDWFLETARRERSFPLKPNTTTQALLTHLNLLEKGKRRQAMSLFLLLIRDELTNGSDQQPERCHSPVMNDFFLREVMPNADGKTGLLRD